MRMVVAELQETLEPSARMLWTLAIVAMGQIHYQASTLQPLAFPGCDELVNNALGIVGKVAELGFPDGEEVGRYERVPEFEAKSAVLRERGVTYYETRLVRVEVIKGNVFLFIDLVVNDGVALGKGAALNVLTRPFRAQEIRRQVLLLSTSRCCDLLRQFCHEWQEYVRDCDGE